MFGVVGLAIDRHEGHTGVKCHEHSNVDIIGHEIKCKWQPV